MKSKHFKLITLTLLMIVISCDDPETTVTNIVHSDGSVTRKIEMRSGNNDFKQSSLQVPFDTSWVVKDSLEINEKGDTTWIKRAEKLFKNAEEINLSYKLDSGTNREISRKAVFNKKFKWFNTEYRFSESIDKTMQFGYPLSRYLSTEELRYFFSPDNLKSDNENGPDTLKSLKFKVMSDSIKYKTDKWTTANLVSDWIGEFTILTGGKEGKEISREYLRAHESEIVKVVEDGGEKLDSLWDNGIILRQVIGELNALKYKKEADSATAIVTKHFLLNFKDYSVKIVMPGKLTGTNGFIDSSNVLLWPVKSDFFLTEPYEMWAESRLPNRWAWFVSGLFLVFVLTGFIIRIIKKG